MKKYLLFLLTMSNLLPLSWGQTSRQYIRAAEEEFSKMNYYAAMKYYREALDIDGERPEVLYKYAEAARLMQSYTFADTAYSKVLAGPAAANYPRARYWLAMVKKEQGKYEEARENFLQFSREAGKEDSQLLELALNETRSLEQTILAANKPDRNVSVSRLGDYINTPYKEFAPRIIDGQLYFSSLNAVRTFKKEDVPRQYAILLRADTTARKVESLPINDPLRHTAHLSFNTDHTRLYYCLCDYVGASAEVRCEIWYRPILADNTFGNPARLPQPVNLPGFTSTDPAVAYDEESGNDWLLFTSDRPGGKGKLDLWSVMVDQAGNCTEPLNLSELNTPENDISPFYHAPSHTMYFSTDGRSGFGNHDICSASLKEGKWTDIKLLPLPYNSSYSDTHFWLNDRRTRGYFASTRLGSLVLEPEYEACCDDLYSFEIGVADLRTYVFNKADGQALPGVTLELLEINPDGEDFPVSIETNADSNDFDFELRKGTRYRLLATKPGFLPVQLDLDMSLPEYRDQRSLERKIYLVPEQVALKISSFNSKSGNPLKGVEVRLVVDGQEVDFRKNNDGNEVSFSLGRGRRYQVIGYKVAYFADTIYVDLRADNSTTALADSLFLKPKELEDFPPLVIYFDNDYPDPKSVKPTTETSYEETWRTYMTRKEKFAQEYVKDLSGMDSLVSARRMEAFFDREVQNGFLSLDVFSENILEIMQDGGFKVALTLQGFTSPRADAHYNLHLSQRRSDCLKNHFETWRGGILMPYVKEGMITMEVVGYGENLAPQSISDRLDDERGSIYSVAASVERRVAIIGARRVAEN